MHPPPYPPGGLLRFVALPAGLKATLKTPPSWPRKGSAAALPSRVQSRTVPSLPPESKPVQTHPGGAGYPIRLKRDPVRSSLPALTGPESKLEKEG